MDQAKEPLAIDLEISIDAPPARVWSIIATPEGMGRWQGATLFEPWIGGRTEFALGPRGLPAGDGEVAYLMTGRIVRFEPERLIAYTWRQRTLGGESWPTDTLITLRLEPSGGGTLVRATHSGFENLPGELAARSHREYRAGWESHEDLAKLKRMAEEVPAG